MNKILVSLLALMVGGSLVGSEGDTKSEKSAEASEVMKIKRILGKSDVHSFVAQLDNVVAPYPSGVELNKDNKAVLKKLLAEVMDFSAQEVKDLNQDIKQYQEKEKQAVAQIQPEVKKATALFEEFIANPSSDIEAQITELSEHTMSVRGKELKPLKDQFIDTWGKSLTTLKDKIVQAFQD